MEGPRPASFWVNVGGAYSWEGVRLRWERRRKMAAFLGEGRRMAGPLPASFRVNFGGGRPILWEGRRLGAGPIVLPNTLP